MEEIETQVSQKIEEVVNTFAPVLDCAVVGVAHEHLGEVPALFVVARPGHAVGTEALLAHCRARGESRLLIR